MRAEVALLATFFRRLNDVASKGVHANVTAQEVYMFLYNVIGRLQNASETPSISRESANT
jgi:hypothetical protein